MLIISLLANIVLICVCIWVVYYKNREKESAVNEWRENSLNYRGGINKLYYDALLYDDKHGIYNDSLTYIDKLERIAREIRSLRRKKEENVWFNFLQKERLEKEKVKRDFHNLSVIVKSYLHKLDDKTEEIYQIRKAIGD